MLLAPVFLGRVASGAVVFNVDPAQSIVSMSGNVAMSGVGTFPFQAQGAGSLTTTYGGQILVDLSPPYLQLPGGSLIRANTNGTWQPGSGGTSGTAPADYGGKITPPLTTAYAAARNIQLDLAGPSVLPTNGNFDASLLTFTFVTNPPPSPVVDYLVTSLIPGDSTNGTVVLDGTSTNGPATASITNNSGMLYLTLPVNTSIVSTTSVGVVTFVLTGQIVATAPSSDWVFPVSISVSAGQVTLEWPSVPGQGFSVLTAPSLSGPWNPASGTLTQKSSSTTWTGGEGGNVGFYRVVENH